MADRVPALTSPGSSDTAMEGHSRPAKMAALTFGHAHDLALEHMGMNLSLPANRYQADTYRLDDRMALWYRRNDGPWEPPGLISPQSDIRNPSILGSFRGSQHMFSNSQYRESVVPSECDTVPPGVLPSDSGYGGSYGAKHSVTNGSVCDDSLDRNPETQSLVGHISELNFRTYNQDMMSKGGASSTASWHQSQPPAPPSSTANHQVSYEGSQVCDICNKVLKTKSEYKKHKQRHDKPFKCEVPGCSRTEGFSTPNDLDRHKRSLHPDEKAAGSRYQCPIGACKNKDKIWPRADNFRAHMRRVHQKTALSDDELDHYRIRISPKEDSDLIRGSTAPDFHQFSGFAIGNTNHGPSGWELHRNSVMDISAESSPPEILRRVQVEETPLVNKPSSEDRFHILNSLATHRMQPETNDTLFDGQSGVSRAISTRPNLTLDNTRFPQPEQLEQNAADLHPETRTSPVPRNPEPVDVDLDLTNRDSLLKLLEKLQSSGVLEQLGYKKENPLRPEDAQQEPANNTTGESRHVCTTCQKGFGRRCELKKHEKRHQKPYGCTFPGCSRHFGSKNDWKRHENSQHYMLEHWRCNEKQADNPSEVCGKVVQRRELFKQHLDSCHHVKDQATLDRKLEACRVGRNCDTRFWCGFCQEIVEIKKQGVNPWTERFNHIDDHFHGRNNQEKREISDWREENPPPPPRAESVTNDSEDASVTWPTPASSANSSDVPGNAGLEKRARSASSKRKRDDASDLHVSKRANLRYHCCECLQTMPKISEQCSNYPCEHKLCGNCMLSV
ncbi:hypothetical protein F4820DRAFT_457023 [Hypoxylon rubiginosum]|uniref:Uncharacterized protein n=1 Tax=Hypoxylon rubiginosum TaxID=110542 RepID=A0ACB9Z8C7_9PEZI|nr:hypothetical protein F4820DRAFT_457023 [Hypoxylon rubiginosum]